MIVNFFKHSGNAKCNSDSIKLGHLNYQGINKFKSGFSKNIENSYNFVTFKTFLASVAFICDLILKNVWEAKC